MIIYPAIDIIDGKCVRLSMGDYSKKKIYSDNLENVAGVWIKNGTKYLHLVDLDGAKSGKPTNLDNILKIRNSYPNLFIQVGGGIRDIKTIETYISHGINRIILGTKILKNKEFILSLDEHQRKYIAIDVAIKNGKLCGDGWEISQTEDIESFIKFLEENSIGTFVITDIGKDGMMQGINQTSLGEVLRHVSTKAIISGGVTTLDDIKSILAMNKDNKIDGIIIGKALYEKSINLSEAIDECS
tara:strand:- start:973 stop:1701 length:729 start_codon:yes stop_codon:yes gene_type:complete